MVTNLEGLWGSQTLDLGYCLWFAYRTTQHNSTGDQAGVVDRNYVN